MDISGLPLFLSAAEAARACGVAEHTIRRWVTAGYLAADTSGPILRVRSAALRPWLASTGGMDGQARLGPAGPSLGQGGRNRPSTTATDTETVRPDMTALVDLVRELKADVIAKAEAAAMWQARADMLEAELARLRDTPALGPGQAGGGAEDASAPGAPRPWWRRWCWWRR